MSNPQPLSQKLYSATAIATGGRDGTGRTDDGALEVKLAVPKGLGGAGTPGATNPEVRRRLCRVFRQRGRSRGANQKLNPGPISITAKVDIGPAGKGFGLQVELVASLPDLPREQAQALITAAHEVCPYSNATRGNIVVDLRLA